MRCKKGGGYGISESSINYSVKNNLGKYPMHPEKYSSCGGVKNPSNLGASIQRGGKSVNYGFSSQGANMGLRNARKLSCLHTIKTISMWW